MIAHLPIARNMCTSPSSPGVQAKGTNVVPRRRVILPHVSLADAHVGPGTHVVGLRLQGALVRCDGLAAVRAVGQRRSQLVPQRVVLLPQRQRRPATHVCRLMDTVRIRTPGEDWVWLRSMLDFGLGKA